MEPLTVNGADGHAPLVRVSPGQLGDVLGRLTTFLLSTPSQGQMDPQVRHGQAHLLNIILRS